jgi:hypothetical protein
VGWLEPHPSKPASWNSTNPYTNTDYLTDRYTNGDTCHANLRSQCDWYAYGDRDHHSQRDTHRNRLSDSKPYEYPHTGISGRSDNYLDAD